jgi:hypothetical protein
MYRLRAVVREHNVHRWAGTLIADLAAIRVSEPDAALAREPRAVRAHG